jgi:hypothetical protein
MGNLRSLGCFGRLREEDKSDRKNQEHRNDESLEGSHCVNFRNTWSNGCEWGSYIRHLPSSRNEQSVPWRFKMANSGLLFPSHVIENLSREP